MKRIRETIGVVENVGVMDRILRLLIGTGLITLMIVHFEIPVTGDLTAASYAALLSLYPFLTAMLGWDPFYALFHAKTCGTSDRNRCGTIGYQIDAALAHHPDHDKGYEVHGRPESERVKGVDYGGNFV